MGQTRQDRSRKSGKELQDRILELEERLAESEETLRALRNGEVDAVIASGSGGDQIYTLKGADHTYRLFVQDMAEGAITLTPEGLIAFSNEQFAAIVGVPLEQVIGSRIQDFADSENAAILSALLTPDAVSRKLELCLTTSTGVVVPVYVSVNRLTQDAFDCICATITDLTQVKARAMLAQSEERFRTLVSIITDVPWTADAEGRFVAPQPAWSAYTGQTWAELRDFGWANAVHPEDRQRVRDAWERACKARELYETQSRVWHAATQDYRFVETRATPLLNHGGDVREWVGACTDVEERKRFETALLESAERLRFMAESMPQKIFTAKPNGDVDYVNRQWFEFTGLPFENMGARGWTHFIHPDDLEENLRLWQHSIDTGEVFQCIQRFRRKDGVYRWHLSRAQALRDSTGKTSMWIGSNTEIHEQKEIEEELRRLNEDLTQFAFAASHDLQEPLRMITSYSQLLVKDFGGNHSEDAEVCVGYIAEGTERMRALLADLLSYTAAGAEQPEPEGIVDLNRVFETVIKDLSPAITESGASVTSDDLPSVRGHQAHFVQLLENLIGNALKYRAEQPLRVHVTAEKRKLEWRFAVADNGIGIAAEYHQKIFGVFKRLHGKSIPGTGIGLAICQRVVTRYGGRLWVESEQDRGATFYFTLPLAEEKLE
jgi:PAS domain S-box-containing protein